MVEVSAWKLWPPSLPACAHHVELSQQTAEVSPSLNLNQLASLEHQPTADITDGREATTQASSLYFSQYSATGAWVVSVVLFHQ